MPAPENTSVPPFSISIMRTLLAKLMARHVPYLWGGKAPSLDCDSNDITGIDCSGFSRWLAYRATGGALTLPEGSVAQHQWAAANLTPATYHGIREYGKGRLFIAFENPNPVGHVWFVDGDTCMTMESHGHSGPGSRQYDSDMFLRIVDACYELPRKD